MACLPGCRFPFQADADATGKTPFEDYKFGHSHHKKVRVILLHGIFLIRAARSLLCKTSESYIYVDTMSLNKARDVLLSLWEVCFYPSGK